MGEAREDPERWRNELRPRAVRLIAERTAKLGWSPMLLRLLLEDIRPDELFLDVLGKPDRLAAKRYPQAIAVALALRHSWQRDDLLTFSKRLGVKVTSKDLADTPRPSTARPEPHRRAATDRPRKTPKRAHSARPRHAAHGLSVGGVHRDGSRARRLIASGHHVA